MNSGKDNVAEYFLGVKIPEILLPSAVIDRSKWPVVACDQFTSQPEYWDEVSRIAGDDPSSFHIILPELYLEHPGDISVPERIASINAHMEQYLGDAVLTSAGECMVLVDRKTHSAPSRKGLVLSIDLEKYDYEPGNSNLIRATEGTVIERIPPRLEIRKNAILEIPHVLLLVNDPQRSIIEPLAEFCAEGRNEILYDLDLMQGGGHVRGYRIPSGSEEAERALDAMALLPSLTGHGLLFVVGDGNHSLAAAKAHWENIKGGTSAEENFHPARYALVEVINIYDEGLIFEPIHRVVFNVSLDDFIAEAPVLLPDSQVMISEKMSFDNAVLMAENIDPAVQPVPVFSGDDAVVFTFSNPPASLAVGTFQILIDRFIGTQPSGARVDYIHGRDVVIGLAKEHVGLLLPNIPKDSFFDLIVREGVLPRKAFSLGEAAEKRYYIECKMIVE
ncbi:MAG: DUF1015 domain-containing protein [Saccharofermentanales bacterium]